jgi:hypothetical protein
MYRKFSMRTKLKLIEISPNYMQGLSASLVIVSLHEPVELIQMMLKSIQKASFGFLSQGTTRLVQWKCNRVEIWISCRRDEQELVASSTPAVFDVNRLDFVVRRVRHDHAKDFHFIKQIVGDRLIVRRRDSVICFYSN